jgi:hypothetical protein|tara:strand:- start:7495 stop:7686 length:192 start_codon:yes stop_codon:yes gene_type:complete
MVIQGDQIGLARLMTLKKMLKLEVRGMKRSGRSAYSIIKSEYGFRGSKQKVLDQLESMEIQYN